MLSGKYRLESLIAVGGMGSVWLGTHTMLGQKVAVKFVDVGERASANTVSRFLREARLAASVRHPNVVDVLDFGLTDEGEPVMIMELLEGDTLATRMCVAPPLTTVELVELMAQVLSGLDAVHRAGVLHCDIKPANIIVASEANEPFARLVDFGTAFAVDPHSDMRRGRFGTDAHFVIGTPEYMSPEQAEGRRDLDERADVYAVSVILYQLLSGVSPFEDEHPGRVLYRVMGGTHTPLWQRRPDIPELAAVVETGMSRDRAARPRSARELRRALLSVASRASTSTR